MPNFLETIYKQTGIGQSRSSVLNPLQWMLVILIGGLSVVLSEDFSLARTAMDKGLFTAEIAPHLLHRENQLKQGKGINVKNLQELKERPERTRWTSKKGAKTE